MNARMASSALEHRRGVRAEAEPYRGARSSAVSTSYRRPGPASSRAAAARVPGGRPGAETRLEATPGRAVSRVVPVPAASGTKAAGCPRGRVERRSEFLGAQRRQIADQRGDAVAGPAPRGVVGAVAQRAVEARRGCTRSAVGRARSPTTTTRATGPRRPAARVSARIASPGRRACAAGTDAASRLLAWAATFSGTRTVHSSVERRDRGRRGPHRSSGHHGSSEAGQAPAGPQPRARTASTVTSGGRGFGRLHSDPRTEEGGRADGEAAQAGPRREARAGVVASSSRCSTCRSRCSSAAGTAIWTDCPQTAAAIVVVNHVSHVDPVLVAKMIIDGAAGRGSSPRTRSSTCSRSAPR